MNKKSKSMARYFIIVFLVPLIVFAFETGELLIDIVFNYRF